MREPLIWLSLGRDSRLKQETRFEDAAPRRPYRLGGKFLVFATQQRTTA